MPYITYTGYPDKLGDGRSAYDVTFDPDTLVWAGSVDKVLPGEVEINRAAFNVIVDAHARADVARAAARAAALVQAELDAAAAEAAVRAADANFGTAIDAEPSMTDAFKAALKAFLAHQKV